MGYTVKEVAEMTHVTVKALHYYHKIGLLYPGEVTDAGYRLYGKKELERLQQILFYRELDFPLQQIKDLLESGQDRLSVLSDQRRLLLARKRRLEDLIHTLEETIRSTKEGEPMDTQSMFRGFDSEEEWKEALHEQSEYLKEKYNYDLEAGPILPEELNEQAKEAVSFMNGMAEFLRSGVKFDDAKVMKHLRTHLDFLNRHGHSINEAEFAAQARFFVQDDFHRGMLEAEQTGLSYYLCMAAEAQASAAP